jgi:uncharacterized repeat protein (TIGR03803 family)
MNKNFGLRCQFSVAIILMSLLSVSLRVRVAEAANFKLLHSFAGGSDGCYPGFGSLVMDGAGNLYGTTTGGGTCGICGNVFKLAPDGTETPLYSFTCGSNGEEPDGLFRDANGNLYGTTIAGGGDSGCGVVFEFTARGTEKTLHTFSGPPNDGCTPFDAPIMDGSGSLYGTTTGGGANRVGSVFKLAKDGPESLLRSFNETRGGCSPLASLVIDATKNLFGVAQTCGSTHHAGTVFELSPHGRETVLYKFKGPPNDGSVPQGTLIKDQSGNLYGTLNRGGRPGCEADEGCGAVFELAPDGTETIIHFFTGKRGDGGNPVAGVIADSSGNFYGTTEFGGSNAACNGDVGCGTVFEIAPDGTETVLHSFGDGSKGANPVAGLVADGQGNFYGTASNGGADGYGTVFEITP